MFRSRIKSFGFAINGLMVALKSELNMKIHLIAALIVLVLSWYFRITNVEWVVIIFVIGLVMIAELFNTAIEALCDHVNSELHENIKKVKDVAAGAVLLAAIVAFIIGVIIFLPYINDLFS